MSILTGGSSWPPEGEKEAWALVSYYAALRDGLEGPIRQQARLRQMGADPKKPYIAVPLPGLISRVPADLLFGEEPRFIAADENDQEALADLVEANGLAAELHRAAIVSASEGGVGPGALRPRRKREPAHRVLLPLPGGPCVARSRPHRRRRHSRLQRHTHQHLPPH